MVKRKYIRWVSLSIALLFALPFGWGKLSGLSNWMSPFVMLNSVFALKSLVLLNSIGFIVLTASWFRRRFFCRYLCPTGFLLERIPKIEKLKRNINPKKFPYFGKWFSIISLAGAAFGFPLFIYLDPLSLFNGFFGSLFRLSGLVMIVSLVGFMILLIMQLIWPGLWCKRICPLGGLQLWVSELKSLFGGTKQSKEKIAIGRRFFIGSAMGSVAAVAFPVIAKSQNEETIRPPASLEPEEFYPLCTRCGSCLKACPTKILKQDLRFGFGFLTPVAGFESGYCLETCNACSVVCPSGAITLFSVEAKPQIIMGKAIISLTDCLLSYQTECDRCKVVCAYKAILIKGKNGETLMLPEVVEASCVGCGACKIVCPKNCIKISGKIN